MVVNPLRVTLVPSLGQTSATLTLANTRDRPLPFEVTAERRLIAEDGTQTFEPAEDDFVIFPPQGRVEPGRSQAMRIQYVGPADVTQTQGYVIRVSEVPVTDPNFSGVQFAYAFGVAVYVKPQDARDAIQVTSFERTPEGLVVQLTNSGNDYSLLSDKRLRIEVGGQRLTFEGQQLGAMLTSPLVPPASRRTLRIAIPNLPAGDVTALSFDPRS
jgi:fimbrial chaperone protein